MSGCQGGRVTGWEVGGHVVVVRVLCGIHGDRVTGFQGDRVTW